jgi:hypothetical protein
MMLAWLSGFGRQKPARTPKLAAFFCRPASRNRRGVLNQAVVALL